MRTVGTITAMTTDSLTPAALYRLMVWLSPSFPVGAFSYSHGLECLIESGAITDEASLLNWVRDVLLFGSGRCDAILFVQAYEAARDGDVQAFREVAELAVAYSPGAERHLETTAQGRAFADMVGAAWSGPSASLFNESKEGEIAYPVAVALAAAEHDLPLEAALLAYLHAFAANLISAGVRLIPLGQTAGQRVTAAIECDIVAVVKEARRATLDDLGSGLLLADLASLAHETQYTRLFRS